MVIVGIKRRVAETQNYLSGEDPEGYVCGLNYVVPPTSVQRSLLCCPASLG